jgi:murein DD-endopeptidase MepM/ murein hydrolase activator NlpD
MLPPVRPWRPLAPIGRLLGWLLAGLAAHAGAQPACGPSCELGAAAPHAATGLAGSAGGARTPREWSGAPTAMLPRVWSPSMSRQDVRLGRVNADHDDAYLYRLPYADGVTYPVIQAYGAKLSHRGAEQFTIDFGMPVGTPVYAAREGVVVLFEDSHEGGCFRDECSKLANFVVILHDDGTTGEYFHLQHGSVQVAVGQHVTRGQPLARSGNTGYSTAPHLHFGVYRTAADGHTQSLPVRFATRLGAVVAPRTGARYLNAAQR